MDLSSKARKTISSSSTSFGSPSSSSSTKGVQKFYTKIRHKIEDSIPPKITAKLHRTPKAVPVQTAKPVAAPRTKRRQHLQQKQQQQLQQPADSSSSPMAPPKVELIRQHSTPATYENIRISSNPLGFFDSDDECRMSVNESALSLEDEIFEELEKVAHDEAKLNAVLKNFDKILADFNERSTAVAAQTAKSTAATATNPSSSPSESETPLSKPDGFKQLQKSKTCSIIESRCILKNSTSDSDDPPNVKLSQYRAYQITKSLWSLQDFEEFAKSGKKPERFECKLPILHNSSLLKGFKANNETTPPKNRNLLPKSTSVWELSSSHSPPSYNGCHRTSSGSKIPIKKPPLRLAIAGRSNSFVDPPTSVYRTSDRYTTHVERAQHSLMKSSTPIRSSSMRKLTELPTITPTRSPVHRTLSRTNSSMMSNSRGNTSINLIKKRSLSAAVSTPHSLNKVGIATKVHATKSVPPSSSLCTSLSSSRLTLKSARSEVSLRQPRYMKNHQSPHRDDVLLNRCLEKGHQILRRVEAFGSVARIDKATSNLAKRDFISPSAIRSHQRAKDDAVIPAKPQRQPAHQHNFTLIIVDKKKPSSSVTPKFITTTPLSKAPPTSQNHSASMKTAITVTTPDSASLSFAAEKVLKNPIVEACRIIPPILGDPSQQHAELMVNVKSRSPPLRTNQDAILFANRMTARANSYEKEYQSDCSDDSGHISNENDEQYANVVQQFSPTATPVSTPRHPHHHHQTLLKGKNKISELLEKFEQTATNKRAPVPEIDRVISPASTTPLIVVSPTTPASKVHTTVKVAEIKPCIQSVAVEIIPTYSNEVLFRSGVLNQLEAKRDELLSDRIVQLQAYCRGYLARRRVSQKRVQELAVRCIQRNVKAFLAVRDWPWWRLLVRVTPLLNVHRTEEQLKLAQDELQTLRAKLEKVENERSSLKTDNEKLEGKLSEMTVDLAEERSAANMTSERLESETAERLKLEKDLQEQQVKVKNLQETSEKLEMELICAKSDLNGISEDEDADNEDSGGVYKLKYERVARELEFTKRRLQTQHEHDLEQLVGLKKQLEKKLADAYEEVEEQRQVVGQWKRKAQKMTNEMNDLRMLLEEQNSRNNLLEKKQRKFDSECQSLQDAARQERQAKDRLAREKDVLIAEKFTLEQNLADTRLELELKEEKLTAVQREMDEMTFGGGSEEEFAQLRRSKIDLERRLKEQEEELDEMAGQVQLLEQAKLRLEMSLETMRKEAKREAQQRDEELEEARGNSYKKIKALECQLENEHEERTLLVREKHELERRLQSAEEQDRVDRQAEEAANQKLRRDLRKYKALLKDAHAQLERAKADSPGKALIRQLRNQLEDAEAARSVAMKARQSAEGELAETQALYEEANRGKHEAEDRAMAAIRDRSELQAQIEENEEEMAELMKKYTATVKQLNSEQSAMSEYEIRISELEAERNSLKEQVSELQSRLENIENQSDPSAVVHSKRLELRAKELESRLELEQATRARLEIQANRHKDALEKIQNELSQSKVREMQAQEATKKVQKSLRELREEMHVVSNREQESVVRRKDSEKRIEAAEAESTSLRNDLRLALQRIADLQQAMEEGDDDDVTESDDSDSTEASLSDLEQRLKPIQTKRMLSVSMTKDTANGISDTTLVIRERKGDNSPRITLTSPSTTSIPDMSLKNGDASYA